MDSKAIVLAILILNLLVLLSIVVYHDYKQSETTELIMENCKLTGEFGVLRDGDSFALYDCNDKGPSK